MLLGGAWTLWRTLAERRHPRPTAAALQPAE
jgi:hypothetical protein